MILKKFCTSDQQILIQFWLPPFSTMRCLNLKVGTVPRKFEKFFWTTNRPRHFFCNTKLWFHIAEVLYKNKNSKFDPVKANSYLAPVHPRRSRSVHTSPAPSPPSKIKIKFHLEFPIVINMRARARARARRARNVLPSMNWH